MSSTLKGPLSIDKLSITEQFTAPAGSITNQEIKTGANLDGDNLMQTLAPPYRQAHGTDVVSETTELMTFENIGTVKRVTVRPRVAPTGGDKQFTVDVQKVASGSNTGTSLLSSVVTVDNTSVDDTNQIATLIGTPTFAAGESLRIVVVASGSTGSQGQGFTTTVKLHENGA